MFEKRQQKLLTIPTILYGLFIIYSFAVPPELQPYSNGMTGYYITIGTANGIIFLQTIYLIYTLWNKNVFTKSKNWEWTIGMIMFPALVNCIFIWTNHTRQEKN